MAEFDLWQLIIVDIFGVNNTAAFFFVSLMIISFLSAKFRVPSKVFFPLVALYGIIISSFFQSVLVLVLFLIAGMVAFSLGKLGGNR